MGRPEFHGEPANASRDRAWYPGVDAARGIGAVGIVQFHLGESMTTLAYAMLPMFFLLTFGFAYRTARGRSIGSLARSRSHRLLFPWLIWSCLYAALMVALAREGERFGWVTPGMAIYGPKIHLWFLPGAFVGAMLVGMAAKWNIGPRGRGVLLAMCAVGYAAIAHRPVTMARPMGEWLFMAPSIPAGLLMGLWMHDGQEESAREGLWWCAGGWVAAAGVIAGVMGVGWGSFALLSHAAGNIAAIVALRVRLPRSAIVAMFGQSALFVYLSHPLLASALIRMGFAERSDLTSVVVIVGSFVAAMMLSMAPWGRLPDGWRRMIALAGVPMGGSASVGRGEA